MYCYKLNNSYTTYINFAYLNDCISASKGQKKSQRPLHHSKAYHEDIIIPLPINASVRHKIWGEGIVTAKDQNGIITVAFHRGNVKFAYPDAFVKGHLVEA